MGRWRRKARYGTTGLVLPDGSQEIFLEVAGIVAAQNTRFACLELHAAKRLSSARSVAVNGPSEKPGVGSPAADFTSRNLDRDCNGFSLKKLPLLYLGHDCESALEIKFGHFAQDHIVHDAETSG